MTTTGKCAMVIGGKVYAAWKQKMLHDVTLHDVSAGTKRYIYRWGIRFCCWLRPRTVHALRENNFV